MSAPHDHRDPQWPFQYAYLVRPKGPHHKPPSHTKHNTSSISFFVGVHPSLALSLCDFLYVSPSETCFKTFPKRHLSELWRNAWMCVAFDVWALKRTVNWSSIQTWLWHFYLLWLCDYRRRGESRLPHNRIKWTNRDCYEVSGYICAVISCHTRRSGSSASPSCRSSHKRRTRRTGRHDGSLASFRLN